MKRFILFGYETYYPLGGARDFISSHESLEEAMDAGDFYLLRPNRWERIGSGYLQVAEYDLDTGHMVPVKIKEFDYDSGKEWTVD